MKRLSLLIALACCAAAAPARAGPLAAPDVQGPDVPAATAPAAVVTAFDNEVFQCTEGPRTRTIDVPALDADRIVLVLTIVPVGEPWDRLFGVAIGGVEVLRGTTPRTDMTLRKDITEFASLLPQGGTAEVALTSGSYWGKLLETVKIEFYAAEPTAALVRSPAARVVPAFRWNALGGNGSSVSATATFGQEQPSSAAVELTITGHGAAGEFWYLYDRNPRTLRILVDGQEIAYARSMPYVYAFVGFGSGDCSGGSNGSRQHQAMWWTAQQAADIAGAHTGVGEIPPYRVALDEADLGLLTGARTVTVSLEGGYDDPQYWPTSVSFLLR